MPPAGRNRELDTESVDMPERSLDHQAEYSAFTLVFVPKLRSSARQHTILSFGNAHWEDGGFHRERATMKCSLLFWRVMMTAPKITFIGAGSTISSKYIPRRCVSPRGAKISACRP